MRTICLAILASLLCACSSMPAKQAFVGHQALRSPQTAVYGVTLLRSHDPDPANLVAFIEKNWFVMDREAVRQGLMTSYDVVSTVRGETDAWNVAVIVGYPTKGGYADIRERFEAIRAAHAVVPVAGHASISGLGRIAGSQTLAPSPNRT